MGMTESQVFIADALEHLISDISEEAFFAGWLKDVEFYLWDHITKDELKPFAFGNIHIDMDLIHTIRCMSLNMSGWLYCDGEHNIKHISYDEWDAMYHEWTQSRINGAGR